MGLAGRLVTLDPHGGSDGEVYPLEKLAFTIGRAVQSDLRIVNKAVSRNHAEILVQGNVVYLENKSATSPNPLTVNGHDVNGKQELFAGDLIEFQLGDHVKVFRFDDINSSAELTQVIRPPLSDMASRLNTELTGKKSRKSVGRKSEGGDAPNDERAAEEANAAPEAAEAGEQPRKSRKSEGKGRKLVGAKADEAAVEQTAEDLAAVAVIPPAALPTAPHAGPPPPPAPPPPPRAGAMPPPPPPPPKGGIPKMGALAKPAAPAPKPAAPAGGGGLFGAADFDKQLAGGLKSLKPVAPAVPAPAAPAPVGGMMIPDASTLANLRAGLRKTNSAKLDVEPAAEAAASPARTPSKRTPAKQRTPAKVDTPRPAKQATPEVTAPAVMAVDTEMEEAPAANIPKKTPANTPKKTPSKAKTPKKTPSKECAMEQGEQAPEPVAETAVEEAAPVSLTPGTAGRRRSRLSNVTSAHATPVPTEAAPAASPQLMVREKADTQRASPMTMTVDASPETGDTVLIGTTVVDMEAVSAALRMRGTPAGSVAGSAAEAGFVSMPGSALSTPFYTPTVPLGDVAALMRQQHAENNANATPASAGQPSAATPGTQASVASTVFKIHSRWTGAPPGIPPRATEASEGDDAEAEDYGDFDDGDYDDAEEECAFDAEEWFAEEEAYEGEEAVGVVSEYYPQENVLRLFASPAPSQAARFPLEGPAPQWIGNHINFQSDSELTPAPARDANAAATPQSTACSRQAAGATPQAPTATTPQATTPPAATPPAATPPALSPEAEVEEHSAQEEMEVMATEAETKAEAEQAPVPAEAPAATPCVRFTFSPAAATPTSVEAAGRAARFSRPQTPHSGRALVATVRFAAAVAGSTPPSETHSGGMFRPMPPTPHSGSAAAATVRFAAGSTPQSAGAMFRPMPQTPHSGAAPPAESPAVRFSVGSTPHSTGAMSRPHSGPHSALAFASPMSVEPSPARPAAAPAEDAAAVAVTSPPPAAEMPGETVVAVEVRELEAIVAAHQAELRAVRAKAAAMARHGQAALQKSQQARKRQANMLRATRARLMAVEADRHQLRCELAAAQEALLLATVPPPVAPAPAPASEVTPLLPRAVRQLVHMTPMSAGPLPPTPKGASAAGTPCSPQVMPATGLTPMVTAALQQAGAAATPRAGVMLDYGDDSVLARTPADHELGRDASTPVAVAAPMPPRATPVARSCVKAPAATPAATPEPGTGLTPMVAHALQPTPAATPQAGLALDYGDTSVLARTPVEGAAASAQKARGTPRSAFAAPPARATPCARSCLKPTPPPRASEREAAPGDRKRKEDAVDAEEESCEKRARMAEAELMEPEVEAMPASEEADAVEEPLAAPEQAAGPMELAASPAPEADVEAPAPETLEPAEEAEAPSTLLEEPVAPAPETALEASPVEVVEEVEAAEELVVDAAAEAAEAGSEPTADEPEAEAPVAEDVCMTCGKGGELILCDGCDAASHLKCARLRKIPKGDWFCGPCKQAKKAPAPKAPAVEEAPAAPAPEPAAAPARSSRRRSSIAPSTLPMPAATPADAVPAVMEEPEEEAAAVVPAQAPDPEPAAPPARSSRRRSSIVPSSLPVPAAAQAEVVTTVVEQPEAKAADLVPVRTSRRRSSIAPIQEVAEEAKAEPTARRTSRRSSLSGVPAVPAPAAPAEAMAAITEDASAEESEWVSADVKFAEPAPAPTSNKRRLSWAPQMEDVRLFNKEHAPSAVSLASSNVPETVPEAEVEVDSPVKKTRRTARATAPKSEPEPAPTRRSSRSRK